MVIYLPSSMSKHVKSRRRSRHWCITINNPAEDPDFYWDPVALTYLVLGYEVGSKRLTPHYQGYVCFRDRKSHNQVCQTFEGAHVEQMFSTPAASAAYCKKDLNWEEFGDMPLTAKESTHQKWTNLIDHARNHDLNAIADDSPGWYVSFYRNWKQIMADNPLECGNLPGTCGYWLHGVSGSGKSHKARELFPDLFDKPLNKWWCGYKNQPAVLLDDFDTDSLKLTQLLKRWADKYPFPAETKGSSLGTIRPRHIVVTSQWSIEELFMGKHLKAMLRRFKQIELPPRVTASE